MKDTHHNSPFGHDVVYREEEVGFVDLWGSFVGRADMYMKDGLHLSGKGAAVFADKLSAAVDSDLGTMTNIFGSKHSLN